jgi:hypothetical protein
MVRLLAMLAQLQPWHLIAFGVVGVIVCATIGLTGVLWAWRSGNGERYVFVVSARIVPDRDEAGPVEWKFDQPNSIFDYSRRGDALWIEGLEFRAINRTGQPLQNPVARVRADRMDKDVALNLAIGDAWIDLSKGFIISPGIEFGLVSKFDIKKKPDGVPADQFQEKFGGLTFIFSYDGGDSFTRYFTPDEIEQQILTIKRSSRKPL